MVTDPIADLINQLKNAGIVKRDIISVPYSKFKFTVASKLKDAGYVKEVTKRGKKTRKCVEIELAYEKDGTPKISGVKRISRPGRRVYERVVTIHGVKYGVGALILSTPKGVLTDKEARKENVGGEALFTIW